jgi:hypothetical protein
MEWLAYFSKGKAEDRSVKSVGSVAAKRNLIGG